MRKPKSKSRSSVRRCKVNVRKQRPAARKVVSRKAPKVLRVTAPVPAGPVPPPSAAEKPVEELVLATVPAGQPVNGHSPDTAPAPEPANGSLPLQHHIEELTCLIDDKPENDELVTRLDQIAARVQHLEQNMLDSLQRHADALLQPDARLQEIASRLQHLEQAVAAQDDPAVQVLGRQIEQLALKLEHLEALVIKMQQPETDERMQALASEVQAIAGKVDSLLARPPVEEKLEGLQTRLHDLSAGMQALGSAFEQLQALPDKVDLLVNRPRPDQKLDQLEADVRSLASRAQTIAAQMEQLGNDKTLQALSGKIEAALQADRLALARLENVEKRLADLQQNAPSPDRMMQTLLARTDLLERRVMEEFQQQAGQLVQATASRIEHLEKALVGKLDALCRHVEDLLALHSDRIVQSSREAAIEQGLQRLTEMVREVLPPPKKQKVKEARDPAPLPAAEPARPAAEAEKPREEKPAAREKKAAVPQEERRKEPRFRADDMSVALFRGGMLKKLIVGKKNIAFYIKDLSNSGMRVQPVEVLEPGEVLSGQITHLRLSETVPIESRVVWFRQTEQGKFEAGVEFINLTAPRAEKLKQIVGYLAQSAAVRK